MYISLISIFNDSYFTIRECNEYMCILLTFVFNDVHLTMHTIMMYVVCP